MSIWRITSMSSHSKFHATQRLTPGNLYAVSKYMYTYVFEYNKDIYVRSMVYDFGLLENKCFNKKSIYIGNLWRIY